MCYFILLTAAGAASLTFYSNPKNHNLIERISPTNLSVNRNTVTCYHKFSERNDLLTFRFISFYFILFVCIMLCKFNCIIKCFFGGTGFVYAFAKKQCVHLFNKIIVDLTTNTFTYLTRFFTLI